MKRIVVRYGLLAGAIVGLLGAVAVPLATRGTVDLAQGQVLGYSAMVLAFVLVYFGIRSYREEQGGTIGFGRAFQVGLLITLVACAVYVVCWEVVYWGFFPDFLDQYQGHLEAKMRADGESEEAIRAARAEMVRFAELYRNPLFNVAITFLEIFPVGLVFSLISAAILRRKAPHPAAADAAA